MGRYLLDTNIVVFMLLSEHDSISRDVLAIVTDYDSELYTSSIVMAELLQLHRLGKIKSKAYKTSLDMFRAVEEELTVKILSFGREHARTLARLDILPDHKDPTDHQIIAHAITERLLIVSSDGKFAAYVPQGLEFIFNRR